MNGRRITSLCVAALTAIAIALAGCSGPMEYHMEPGERTASSEGELLVEHDDNDNHFIEMNVAHLPPPTRLQEGMTTFVLWLKPAESTVSYNMGQLRVGDDRAGYIEFTTPFDAYELQVTAEAGPSVLQPSEQQVLYRAIGMD